MFRAALRARFALSRAYHPLGPLSWREKIWYRPDGSRRSKIKGLVYVTVLSSALFMHLVARALQKSQSSHIFVAKLQLIDAKHPIDESSTPSDVAVYVAALKDAIPLIVNVTPDQISSLAFGHRAACIFSPEYHENVRRALHDVHKIFATGDKPFTEETSSDVLQKFAKFQRELVKLHDILVEAESRLGSDKFLDQLSKVPDMIEAELRARGKLSPGGKYLNQVTATNRPP